MTTQERVKMAVPDAQPIQDDMGWLICYNVRVAYGETMTRDWLTFEHAANEQAAWGSAAESQVVREWWANKCTNGKAHVLSTYNPEMEPVCIVCGVVSVCGFMPNPTPTAEPTGVMVTEEHRKQAAILWPVQEEYDAVEAAEIHYRHLLLVGAELLAAREALTSKRNLLEAETTNTERLNEALMECRRERDKFQCALQSSNASATRRKQRAELAEKSLKELREAAQAVLDNHISISAARISPSVFALRKLLEGK